jgi:hypothetical protein
MRSNCDSLIVGVFMPGRKWLQASQRQICADESCRCPAERAGGGADAEGGSFGDEQSECGHCHGGGGGGGCGCELGLGRR